MRTDIFTLFTILGGKQSDSHVDFWMPNQAIYVWNKSHFVMVCNSFLDIVGIRQTRTFHSMPCYFHSIVATLHTSDFSSNPVESLLVLSSENVMVPNGGYSLLLQQANKPIFLWLQLFSWWSLAGSWGLEPKVFGWL